MNPAQDYPDDEDLDKIKQWNILKGPETLTSLMDYIKTLWWMPDWGWREEDAKDILDRPVRRYSISTAGWSGNESLIEAMESNQMFWMFCWVQSRRGGHYVFEIVSNRLEAAV